MRTVSPAILSLLTVAASVDAAVIKSDATTTTTTGTTTQPNWFQTSPVSYQGFTSAGAAPSLAEINPVTFKGQSFVPNEPLQTQEPIKGAHGRNIFKVVGDLSPYFSPEEGFGVDEYPLPSGSRITQMHMLHRHGSRYPSSSEDVPAWAEGILNSTTAGNKFTGDLSFLNDWTYGLGEEMLTAKGREELFESGVLNWYNYGHLYNSSSKLVVRTTTQNRMLKSAENFLAGFFGLDWTENANLLAMIESTGYNNSLIGMYSCTNALRYMASTEFSEPIATWRDIYLKDRTAAFNKLSGSYTWTTSSVYTAQSLCVYETISFGYSNFCQLFTYEEFEHFGYLIDIEFAAMSGFQSPTGRAQGIAWVEEFLARIEGHLLETTQTNANMTLDTNPVTFPVSQNLYLDFTHDAGIIAAITALGFIQFSVFLPATGPPKNQQFSSSTLVPFAARMNIEIIKTPHQVKAKRPTGSQADKNAYVAGTKEATYIHFIQNQRTIPLHRSFQECPERDDGWCELSTFLKVQKQSLAKSRFQYSCFGDYNSTSYGAVTDGAPIN
ncbi:histidine phosphatase superfamily [Aspergillus granulosus]|uniref:3-phytase n=1 Tax=Aspergillus granulosus TaxID=176169 RepID=A0ABR4GUD2_9EURO